MSGVQIHSQDPITPAKAGGITSHTTQNSNPNESSHPTTATAGASQRYPSARLGSGLPALTCTTSHSMSNGPPPPQPGAVPAPQTTAKPSLPPPPKSGEQPQPPEYYKFQQARPQPYPPQMSQPPLGPGPTGLPPASTTSMSTAPSFPSVTPQTKLPVSEETSSRTSLEHPPGYVQNPYASDMTPDQRFAMEQQENVTKPETLPSLGYYDNSRKKSHGGLETDQSFVEAAMKWGKDKGKQIGDLHEQLWDTIGRK